MENHHRYQKRREKADRDPHKSTEFGGGEFEDQLQAKQFQPPPPPPTPPFTASPPSASSSPAHEFSFTISLHHPPPSTVADKSKHLPPPPSIAVDLSPADEIFFHGHLLPLHLLSHLPVSSPRSSTNSIGNFTLPTAATTAAAANTDPITKIPLPKPRPRSKSFSLFGIPIRRKEVEERETDEREKQRKKLKFDLSQVLKRYMRMVRPLFGGRRENDRLGLRRQPHSFSGYLSPRRNKQDLMRGKRGELMFSAPASMKTSPSNSGLLVGNGVFPTTTSSPSSSTSDSTMEELQAAIQAAIAHCKNSNCHGRENQML